MRNKKSPFLAIPMVDLVESIESVDHSSRNRLPSSNYNYQRSGTVDAGRLAKSRRCLIFEILQVPNSGGNVHSIALLCFDS